MRIHVRESPEPLSPEALRSELILAESEVYNKLYSELSRYTEGSIGGGSVLISGHRGSGKTTLVHKAIQDLIRRLTSGRALKRPLLVPLHGPNLLKLKPKVLKTGEKGEVTKEKIDELSPEEKRDRITENALQEIVLSLYRALTTEFGNAYAEKAKVKRRFGADELAGQFRIELDEASDVAILRQFWKKIDAINWGVLFDEGPNNQISQDQGVNELLALSSAAQAFRIMSGTVEDASKETNAATSENTKTNKIELNLKELSDGLMSIFTGVASGLIAYKGFEDNYLAAGIAALAGAILSKITFSYSSTSTRKKSFTRDYSFIRDRSVSVLDRELPVLIKRIRAAGLSPVFVIDELDKVIPPYDEFGELIGHLKHIVSERAFFIFITDRNYFEHITQLSRNKTYAKEYTYFTHRFYNYYRPNDLHAYLNLKFGLKGHSGFYRQQQTASEDEIRLLSYLLLNRARLHQIDLKREIRKLTKNDTIEMKSGILGSRLAYRFHIMIQLAIEHIINGEDLRDRFDQDSYFAQLAYDALYYPSRRWLSGDSTLEISKHIFFHFLLKRTQRELTEEQEKELIDDMIEGRWSKAEASLPFSLHDGNFLHQKLLELLHLISDSKKLSGELVERNDHLEEDLRIEQEVLSTIPKSSQFLLLSRVDGEEQYEWHFDYYGRKLDPEAYELNQLKQIVRFLFDLESFLNDILDGNGLAEVSNSARVINPSPDWEEVKRAGQDLLANKDLSKEDRELYYNLLTEYNENLLAAEGLLVKVLGLFAYIKQPLGEFKAPAALTYIGLSIPHFGEPSTELDRIITENFFIATPESDVDSILQPDSFEKWKEVVSSELPERFVFKGEESAKFEKVWEERFGEFRRSGQIDFELGLYDLLFLANTPWSVQTGLTEISLMSLSRLISRYLQGDTFTINWSDGETNVEIQEASILRWAVPMMLERVGFGELVKEYIEEFKALVSQRVRGDFEKVLNYPRHQVTGPGKPGIMFIRNSEEEKSNISFLMPSKELSAFIFESNELKSRSFYGKLFAIAAIKEKVKYLILDIASDKECHTVINALPRSLARVPHYKLTTSPRRKSSLPTIELQNSLDEYWSYLNQLNPSDDKGPKPKPPQ